MSKWAKPDLETSARQADKMEYGPSFLKLAGGAKRFEDNWIRIMPPHENMVDPETGEHSWYTVVPVHFNVGPPGASRAIGCLEQVGEGRCAVCELRRTLLKEGDERTANKIRRTWNAYMNVVKIDPETGELDDDRVFVFSCRRKVLNLLLDRFARHGDLSDPKTGRNINIRRKGGEGDLHTEYDIELSEPCPLTDGLEPEDLIDLTTVTSFPGFEETQALLAGGEGHDPFGGLEEGEEVPRLKEPEVVPADDDEDDETTEDEDEDAGDERRQVLEELGYAPGQIDKMLAAAEQDDDEEEAPPAAQDVAQELEHADTETTKKAGRSRAKKPKDAAADEDLEARRTEATANLRRQIRRQNRQNGDAEE